MGETMPNHKTGTREQWLAARNELLAKEKELTRRSDQLAAERRDLPWVPIEKQYRFDTDDGPKTLAELFDGRSQMIVYHFMFGPPYTAGCPACSSIANGFNGAVPHLNVRDVTFSCISRARWTSCRPTRPGWGGASPGPPPITAITTSTRRSPTRRRPPGSGWPAASARLARDCGTEPVSYLSESPVLDSYAVEGGNVYLTYSTTARGWSS
jgi:Bacterial protein of unknown function (DUF899)